MGYCNIEEFVALLKDRYSDSEAAKKILDVVTNSAEKLDKAINDVNALPSRKGPSTHFTNHTGGAYGADSIWADLLRSFGVINIHYRPHGETRSKRPLELQAKSDYVIPVTQEEMNAGKQLNEALGNSSHEMNQRNVVQVRNADTVYAVAPIEKNKVAGGTGSAVRMAEALGRKVYILDTNTVEWYESVNGNYVLMDTIPPISNNFAAVGTRDIEEYYGQKEGKYLGKVKSDALISKMEEFVKQFSGTRSEQGKKPIKLKAGTVYDVTDYGITKEEIISIEKANDEYLKKNKTVKLVAGDTYEYSGNTITYNSNDSKENQAVYIAHEIVHAKTAEWLDKNSNTPMVKKLRESLDKVMAQLENTSVFDMTEEKALLLDRLQWDSGNKSNLTKENVAVLAAEPTVRKALLDMLPDNRSILNRILDRVKEWIGIETGLNAAKILNTVDQIVKAGEAESRKSSAGFGSKLAAGITLKPDSKSLLVPASMPKSAKSKVVTESGFDAKEEYHLTVLGFPEGNQLKKIFESNPEKEAEVQKLIDEADFSYTEKPNEIYKISRDREAWIDWEDQSKGKETLHEEAIITLVDAPGVKEFIGKVNNLLGTNFPVPFPHISMAVKGTKFGIGIPNEQGFKELNPVKLTNRLGTTRGAAQRISNSLAETYPDISSEAIKSIIEKEGLEVISSALTAIMYEKPSEAPAAYARIYIDLLDKTTLVRNVLNNIIKNNNMTEEEAKQQLATRLGKDYVKLYKNTNISKLSKGEKVELSLLEKIWNYIKSKFQKSEVGLPSELDEQIHILSGRFFDGTNREAVRLTPKEGYQKVNPEATFKAQPFAAEILTNLASQGKELHLTGSVALATQGNVYRKGENGVADLHDLDVIVNNKDRDIFRRYLLNNYHTTKLWEFDTNGKGKHKTTIETFLVIPKNYRLKDVVKYNNGTKGRFESYTILDENGKEIGWYKAELAPNPNKGKNSSILISEKATGFKGVTVDLMGSRRIKERGRVQYDSKALGMKITVSDDSEIFQAKNEIQEIPRDKDVLDYASFYGNKSLIASSKTTNDIIKEALNCK